MKKHEKIRDTFTWGRNYNKKGERINRQLILLKNISDSHLESIIKYFTVNIYTLKNYKKRSKIVYPFIYPIFNNRLKRYKNTVKLFETESRYRIINNIKIEDYE